MPNAVNLSSIKKAYFVGIGGVSMSSLALILKDKGVKVSGYDMKSSENTVLLENNGIPVHYTYEDADFDGADTLIYTAAVKEDNPLLVRARENNMNLLTRAQLLGIVTGEYKHSIGVAGTHGKSTTTGFLSEIMLCAKNDSTILGGAVIPSLNSTFRVGKGNVAVFEACEYKNSYHARHPTIKVILNVKLDHVDFFGSMENVIASFRQYIDTPGNNGENISIINLDCENAVESAKYTGTQAIYFSTENKADYYAQNIDISSGYGEFDVYEKEDFLFRVKLSVPGIHNVSNAVAAVAAARSCGIEPDAIKQGLCSFCGVKRRFEKIKVLETSATVIDDYAHHPDEIEATLNSAKAVAKGKVICVFQPHTYSRTKALLKDFATSLSIADKVLLAPIWAARETDTLGVSSKDIAKLIEGAEYLETFEELRQRAIQLSQEGDIIITMGAGDVYRVFQ